jgi:prephenate dehydratase
MGLNPNVHSNTAVAARDIKAWNDPTKAALCSTLAAELYGLKTLKQDMQDREDNITVFVKVAKEMDKTEFKAGEPVLTSVLYTLRNIPAALYKALGGFATNGVNILKLESYIPGGESANAQFFMTFEGNPADHLVKLALEELAFFTSQVEILGVYAAAPERARARIK